MSLRRIIGLLCLVSLLIVGTVLSVKHGRNYLLWDNFGVVEEGRIYRSGELQSYQLRAAAEEYDIKSVLNLNYDDKEEEKLARRLGLKYYKARWSGDGIVREKDLQWAYKIITKPENQPVLIHCARGTSRTGVVVAYYRLRNSHWSRAQVREEMLNYRHQPERNPELEELIDRLFQSQRGK